MAAAPAGPSRHRGWAGRPRHGVERRAVRHRSAQPMTVVTARHSVRRPNGTVRLATRSRSRSAAVRRRSLFDGVDRTTREPSAEGDVAWAERATPIGPWSDERPGEVRQELARLILCRRDGTGQIDHLARSRTADRVPRVELVNRYCPFDTDSRPPARAPLTSASIEAALPLGSPAGRPRAAAEHAGGNRRLPRRADPVRPEIVTRPTSVVATPSA